MHNEFRIQFFGNADACRAEAEITFPAHQTVTDPAVVVYEGSAGWMLDFGAPVSRLATATLLSALARARERLEQYVNRRGENPPPGLTGPGLSLWLLEKTDGTAMGRPIK